MLASTNFDPASLGDQGCSFINLMLHNATTPSVSGEVRSCPLYKMPRNYQRKTETRYRLERFKKSHLGCQQ
ncbi:hypothetical protein QE152_g8455 [Popillia japonica]|uniref:Uncharacterized protein n=1 Tax=Popillia japonica TaxID=7064 RepID=A0AAW1M917_POPJA